MDDTEQIETCFYCQSPLDPNTDECENVCRYCGDCEQGHATCDHCNQCFEIHEICDYCDECSQICECFEAACGSIVSSPDDVCGRCEKCEYCCNCDNANVDCIITESEVHLSKCIEATDQYQALKQACELTNPVEDMATFYLLDFITAHSLGVDEETDLLVKEAKQAQASLVARLDPIFHDYLISAIGGELRYHPSVQAILTGWDAPRRYSSGQYLYLVKQNHERGCELLANAVDIFQDHYAWNDGYGGRSWAQIAEIARLRQCGVIDPRTFVDRVFTLQHNTGTCLSKMTWALTGYCEYVGWKQHSGGLNVSVGCYRVGALHSATIPHTGALALIASSDARYLFKRFVASYNRHVRLLGRPMLIIPEVPQVSECRHCARQRTYAIKFGHSPSNVSAARCSTHYHFPNDRIITVCDESGEY